MITPEDHEAMIEAGYIDRETNSFTEKGILQGLFGLTPGTAHYEAEMAMLKRASSESPDEIERETVDLRTRLDGELG